MSVMPRRRGCMFSSVVSSGRPAKSAPNCSRNASKLCWIGIVWQADAEVLRQRERVVDAARRRKLRRHGDPEDVVRPERVDGDRGGDGAVDAAAEAEHDAFEATLGQVVAQPEAERVVQLLEVGLKMISRSARSRCRYPRPRGLRQRSGALRAACRPGRRPASCRRRSAHRSRQSRCSSTIGTRCRAARPPSISTRRAALPMVKGDALRLTHHLRALRDQRLDRLGRRAVAADIVRSRYPRRWSRRF